MMRTSGEASHWSMRPLLSMAAVSSTLQLAHHVAACLHNSRGQAYVCLHGAAVMG